MTSPLLVQIFHLLNKAVVAIQTQTMSHYQKWFKDIATSLLKNVSIKIRSRQEKVQLFFTSEHKILNLINKLWLSFMIEWHFSTSRYSRVCIIIWTGHEV